MKRILEKVLGVFENQKTFSKKDLKKGGMWIHVQKDFWGSENPEDVVRETLETVGRDYSVEGVFLRSISVRMVCAEDILFGQKQGASWRFKVHLRMSVKVKE
jgi:hypothetical protein